MTVVCFRGDYPLPPRPDSSHRLPRGTDHACYKQLSGLHLLLHQRSAGVQRASRRPESPDDGRGRRGEGVPSAGGGRNSTRFPVLCVPVCKVYRFQTEDQRWLLVREQMSETPLSFSLPKQLLSALIRSHASRVQEVKELGDLSPRWDGLRRDVIRHCDRLIGSYQETLAELEKLSASSCFKSSSSKSDKHLQFVPTNLHSQRMEVSDPDATRVWYEVITFGAPADHHQAFKHGGLKKLLSKHANHRDSCVSYSLDESSRARELLASVARLQPLVFGLAEELLSVSQELSAVRLQQVLDGLTQQTERFVHALKDELVRRALSDAHGNGALPQRATTSREGRTSPGRWDEEEW
uniref:Uncharacterized protein n=1 Tax=Gasterosteus aculeatus aculeatus TaxID=481459 RepID=A0AAQ4RY78_GASAC